MGSSSTDALLEGSHRNELEETQPLKDGVQCADDMACASARCGLADGKNRAEDARSRSSAAKKLSIAVVLCLIFIAVEVAGGLVSHSLAVLTDAAHLLSDVAGFAISLFAIWASSWEATPRQSYGFFRLEILGALLSIQLIWLLTGIIVYEAIYRMIHQSKEVDGRLMFFVATFGFFVNVIMVFLLGHHGHSHSHDGHDHGHNHAHDLGHDNTHDHRHDHSHGHANNDSSSHSPLIQEHADSHSHEGLHNYHRHEHGNDHDHHHEHDSSEKHVLTSDFQYGVQEDDSTDHYKVDIDIKPRNVSSKGASKEGNINVKGAWLHVLGDLIQSIGVMIGGAVIWVKPSWKVVDLICTLFFSVIVLGTTIKILRDIMEVLMESTPREIDAKKLETGLCEIPGVVAIHDLHIWAITMGKTLLACHVTIYPDADADEVLQRVIEYCNEVFNISHVTVQVERQRRR